MTMIKVYHRPLHDCPVLGKLVLVMQLRAYHDEFCLCCEHCDGQVASFELRESVEEVREPRSRICLPGHSCGRAFLSRLNLAKRG
ncbi:MAG: hypothetical protein WCT25_01195 [Candidatus Paceibacterota bacterium]